MAFDLLPAPIGQNKNNPVSPKIAGLSFSFSTLTSLKMKRLCLHTVLNFEDFVLSNSYEISIVKSIKYFLSVCLTTSV